MATVNLGSIKFKWKGTYAGGTAYTIDDVVSYNGSSYICIQASTGNLPTNATYFEQMSSAGTNGTDGTDLTTTLTTQGDIVYRDGSGLARLGAGTSGQVLQTGGTGANPSWGTVSSDYVRITTTTISSAVSGVEIDNIFSTSYDNYVIIGTNVTSSTQDDYMRMRFLDSTGTQIAGNLYRGHSAGAESLDIGNNDQVALTYDNDLFYFRPAGGVVDNGRGGWNFTMNLPNPYANAVPQCYGIYANVRGGSGYSYSGRFHCYYNSSLVCRGIKFDYNGGNVNGGTIAVYGIKTS